MNLSGNRDIQFWYRVSVTDHGMRTQTIERVEHLDMTGLKLTLKVVDKEEPIEFSMGTVREIKFIFVRKTNGRS